MCGLVGIFGDPNYKLVTVFTQLLWIDTLRGHDSTGVMYINDDWKYGIIKTVSVPFFLFQKKEWQEQVNAAQVRHKIICLMGHNRAATQGKVTAMNAHPFKHGHIIGCHNGTLTSTFRLEMDGKKFATDSEHIVYSINQRGIAETWARLTGAAALTFWNLKSRKLSFLRNSQRPLFFAYTKGRKQVIWASEAWMIETVCNRNKVDLETDDKGATIWQIEPNWLWTFGWSKKTQQVTEVTEELDPFKVGYTSTGRPQNNWPVNWEDELARANGYSHEKHPTADVLPFTRNEAAMMSDDKLSDLRNHRMHKPDITTFQSMDLSCCLCFKAVEHDSCVFLDPYTAACHHCYEDAYQYHLPFHPSTHLKQVC